MAKQYVEVTKEYRKKCMALLDVYEGIAEKLGAESGVLKALDDMIDRMAKLDELVEIGCSMSQDIQEYIDAAVEAGGNPPTASVMLLEDWNKAYADLDKAPEEIKEEAAARAA